MNIFESLLKNHEVRLPILKITSYLGLALILFLTVIATGCGSKSDPTTTTISWDQAISNGKPTLAEFGRGTCIPCKQMKPILEEIAVEYDGKLNVMIISVDEYAELTREFKIMSIPTQVFLDIDGKEVSRHVGYYPKTAIMTELLKMDVHK